MYLSIEGAEYLLEPLPPSFKNFAAQTYTLAGRQVLAISNGRHLILISEHGKIIFKSAANKFEFSDILKITADFETCTCAQGVCEYSYDGQTLTLISSSVSELRPPEKEILHFAFFECVLTGADCTKYLDESLKGRAKELKGYLGEFVSVTVPPEKFYTVHGNVPAAGLVYPKGKNLFEIKYYTVQFTGDKISNIKPYDAS